MTRAVWISVAAAAALVLVGAYLGSPYWAARQLASAARQGDRDKLEALVDFPRVRENLKSDLSAKMLSTMNGNAELSSNPFAALGAALAPALTDRLVDSFVTPAGLSSMMTSGKLVAQPDNGARGTSSSDFKADLSYITLDRFRVTLKGKDPNGPILGMVLGREGLFGWRLFRVDLPSNLFASDQPPTPTGAVASAPSAPVLPSPPTPAATTPPTDVPTQGPAPAVLPEDWRAFLSTDDSHFADYTAGVYQGPPQLPDLGPLSKFHSFRTRISAGFNAGVDFAGDRNLTLFGCGTDCTSGYILGLRDGSVLDFPLGGEAYKDLSLSYRRDSRYLKAVWTADDSGQSVCKGEAFVWNGHDLQPAGTVLTLPMGTDRCPTLPQ